MTPSFAARPAARRGPGAVLSVAVLTVLACVAAAPATASQSQFHYTEGAAIRLVTSGLADAEGNLSGALEIRLEPGWKTYWRDPGASGVPPQIDVARSVNADGAELAFPRPGWHRDDYGSWAGYDGPVTLPVTFRIPKPARYSLIEAEIFLGVCQAICIPVQASLTVEPGADPDNEADARIVAAAFASLPDAAGPGFRVASARLEGDRLLVEVELPQEGDAELFLAGAGGHVFGVPRRVGGTPDMFEVVLAGGKQDAVRPSRVDYTLAVGHRAAKGSFELPQR